MMQFGLLILGFALLITGANIFVNASVGIAEKLRIPSVIIGLTIVAVGTGAPEAVISVTASVRGANSLAVGNIVGSNIFNLMFIIALCAIIKPVVVDFKQISKELWVSIFATFILLVLKMTSVDYIPRTGSLILLILFFIYIGFLIRLALKSQISQPGENQNFDEKKQKKIRPLSAYIIFAIFGCVIIFFGGHITVDSATNIAYDLGISQRVIGLTVVAVGTGLPELVTAIVACKKGENEFALGNIVGSNIFNIMFILGIAGAISPLSIVGDMVIDAVFLIAGSLLAFIFVRTGNRISRLEGTVMLLLYVGYMVFILG